MTTSTRVPRIVRAGVVVALGVALPVAALRTVPALPDPRLREQLAEPASAERAASKPAPAPGVADPPGPSRPVNRSPITRRVTTSSVSSHRTAADSRLTMTRHVMPVVATTNAGAYSTGRGTPVRAGSDDATVGGTAAVALVVRSSARTTPRRRSPGCHDAGRHGMVGVSDGDAVGAHTAADDPPTDTADPVGNDATETGAPNGLPTPYVEMFWTGDAAAATTAVPVAFVIVVADAATISCTPDPTSIIGVTPTTRVTPATAMTGAAIASLASWTPDPAGE